VAGKKAEQPHAQGFRRSLEQLAPNASLPRVRQAEYRAQKQLHTSPVQWFSSLLHRARAQSAGRTSMQISRGAPLRKASPRMAFVRVPPSSDEVPVAPKSSRREGQLDPYEGPGLAGTRGRDRSKGSCRVAVLRADFASAARAVAQWSSSRPKGVEI